MIGECPEPHLLRAVDWFDSQGIRRDIDKVYNFKHTLDGEAREWYADYARQADVIPPWNTLINDFSRYYSSQGRGEKNLHEAWRKYVLHTSHRRCRSVPQRFAGVCKAVELR